MQINTRKALLLILVLISIFTLLPYIGIINFHTKGEPREAIVAVSMLNHQNWILPVNNGGDIAYKPPLFHWAIALFSLPEGYVSEYTSRLPSAIAVIVMAICCFLFFAKRVSNSTAFLSVLLTISTFEIHRAAMAARVDMVMTMFMVLSFLQLYKWNEKGAQGISLVSAILMGCSTLTKGPVGIVLPCAIIGLFMLIRGQNFFKVVWKCTLTAVVSCVLPAIWYYLAYKQGGDAFLSLVMEENFGRFMGKMSYESHEQPIIYYFYITLAGFIPWSVLLLISLFTLSYKWPNGKFSQKWTTFNQSITGMSDARLYSLICIVVVFVFFCIPKSKRSVYIMSIYPFVALFLAEYMFYLFRNKQVAWRIFGTFLSVLIGVALVLLLIVRFVKTEMLLSAIPVLGNVSDYIFALQESSISFWAIIAAVCTVASILTIYRSRKDCCSNNRYLYAVVSLFFCFQVVLDAYVLPSVLNQKSMLPFAREVIKVVPEGKIYSYVATPMLRFFVVNFYANDRVVDFEKEQPAEGYLLVGKNDFEDIREKYSDSYDFQPVLISSQKGNDIRDIVYLYSFSKVVQ